MMSTRYRPAFALALSLCAPVAAFAADKLEEPPTLTLNADVRESVAPDLMRVIMAAERTGRDLGAVNRQALSLAQDALRSAKSAGPSIEASLSAVSTQPTYDEKGRPNGWRVRAEVVLLSKTFDKLSTVSGELAERMALDHVGFELSASKRAEVQASLRRALGAQFLDKAKQMAAALGYSNVRIQSVSLSEMSPGRPPMPMYMAKAARAESMSAIAVPAEAAQQEVSITLQGAVILER